MLRYLTSGESHAEALVAILDGMPAGLAVDKKLIDQDLARRQFGYGRGKRMSIESDTARIIAGLRSGVTIGSPLALVIANKDHSIDRLPVVTHPRPGHADLAGALKYNLDDIRSVLERSSARETAARVGVGALCKILLAQFGIRIASHVTMIGGVESRARGLAWKQIITVSDRSPVRCADPAASQAMCRAIDAAMAAGDTLGGIFEIVITGVPVGLGSHTQWDRRLDAALARGLMSIQAVKGVSFGIGFDAARRNGSQVHDEIFYNKKQGFYRTTNHAGGIEGGISNGEDIIVRTVMKPIATLTKPLASVNIKTKKPVRASVERSDVCAVPAAGIVGEAACAFEIANAFVEKFGGDSLGEMRRNFDGYQAQVKKF